MSKETNRTKWKKMSGLEKWAYIRVAKGKSPEIQEYVEKLRSEKDIENNELGNDKKLSEMITKNLDEYEELIVKDYQNRVTGRAIWEERKKRKSAE